MKTADTPTRTLIESGKFARADLFTLTLVSGTIVRTTSADIDLVWGGNTFYSCLPMISRDFIRTQLGMEVDSLGITIHPKPPVPANSDPGDLLEGIPFLEAVRLGALDGCKLLHQKAYLPDWNSPITGVLHGFEGAVSDIDGGRGQIEAEVKSALELLNTEMPRNVYQSVCLHTVYDPGCTLLRSSFTVTGAVTSGGTLNGNTFDTNLTQAADYFEGGVLAFTSGVLNGTRRTVKTYAADGRVVFALPLKQAPAVGDTFSIYPGCNRVRDTCINKFNNVAHFKGYPFIPTPETAAGAVAGTGSGSSRK